MPAKKARRKRTAKAKASGSRDHEFVDATKPFTIHVTWDDIHGAQPGDSRNCVLSRAGRREHNCFDITVYRGVAYVRKTERSVPVRYQVTQSAHDLLVSFDASGRSHPITVTFVPPRRGISKAYLRSPERKAKEKAYRERCKKRQEVHEKAVIEGRVTGRRRTYTKPDPLTLFGVRNGTGARLGKLRV
jgi:hypothetical protein